MWGKGEITSLLFLVMLNDLGIFPCNNCGKIFTLMPIEAGARMKSKQVFHSFACRNEWFRKQRVKG